MKGKVGTPCKDEFLRKTDNIKTTKEIRANKTKILKEIKIILNSKSNYNYIKVGTPCKDEFLRKTDNIKTTKEIRANKTKILKEIKIILNSKSNYNYIAKELEMHTIDVLQLLQEETLQFGTNISKAMTKHLMDRGVTVSEIAELYNCDEIKVLLTLNEINDNDYRNKIKEIGIALKIYKLLEKSKGFNFISSKLNIDKYKAFNIYNKYFHR